MQKKTVEYIRSRHSADDEIENTSALYTRDEVEGPLVGKGRETSGSDGDVVYNTRTHEEYVHHSSQTQSEEAVGHCYRYTSSLVLNFCPG